MSQIFCFKCDSLVIIQIRFYREIYVLQAMNYAFHTALSVYNKLPDEKNIYFSVIKQVFKNISISKRSKSTNEKYKIQYFNACLFWNQSQNFLVLLDQKALKVDSDAAFFFVFCQAMFDHIENFIKSSIPSYLWFLPQFF